MRCNESPKVLLVADDDLCRLWSENVTCVEWITADDDPDVLNVVRNGDVDMVLVDLLIGPGPGPDPGIETALASESGTIYQFDHVPFAAKGISRGQQILRRIHETSPDVPCFLIYFGENGKGRPSLGDELLMSCLRSGGARGVIGLRRASAPGLPTGGSRLANSLLPGSTKVLGESTWKNRLGSSVPSERPCRSKQPRPSKRTVPSVYASETSACRVPWQRRMSRRCSRKSSAPLSGLRMCTARMPQKWSSNSWWTGLRIRDGSRPWA